MNNSNDNNACLDTMYKKKSINFYKHLLKTLLIKDVLKVLTEC